MKVPRLVRIKLVICPIQRIGSDFINDFTLSLNDISCKDTEYIETIFSLENGHFGVRASDPIVGDSSNGTFINGFYEVEPIIYGENAYGYAKNHQTIFDLADLRHLNVKTDDGHMFKNSERISTKLNFKTGILEEEFIIATAQNEQVLMTMNSVIDPIKYNLWEVSYSFSFKNYIGKIWLDKSICAKGSNSYMYNDDPRKSRKIADPDYKFRQINDKVLSCNLRAKNTVLNVNWYIVALSGVLNQQSIEVGPNTSNSISYRVFIGDVCVGREEVSIPNIYSADVFNDSKSYWEDIGRLGYINVDDCNLNTSVHYNLFQLNQAAIHEENVSIPAKGLSGSGYEGHYFWDTEMYMLPYFIYTNPKVAKRILMYRFNTLNYAKKRAKKLGINKGALYPWRTINGKEASPYFPAGTAQYHINGDIAYAVGTYYEATHDIEFIKEYGFLMVLETARFWVEFGTWVFKNGKKTFDFLSVTGPDEYTALINNNYYTNKIAQNNLQLVSQLFKDMHISENYLAKYNCDISEIRKFKYIAKNIYLPFNKEKGIFAQDDSFLEKPLWPDKKDKHPLLLHYHPLTLYRYQIAKQADVLLSEMLFRSDSEKNRLKKELFYYDSVTTHDSSLSQSTFSLIASLLKEKEIGYSRFLESSFLDLDNTHKNTGDGLHLANMGGMWMAIVYGFAGFCLKDGVVSITNNVPDEIENISFKVIVQNRIFDIFMTRNNVAVKLASKDSCNIIINGLCFDLIPGEKLEA